MTAVCRGVLFVLQFLGPCERIGVGTPCPYTHLLTYCNLKQVSIRHPTSGTFCKTYRPRISRGLASYRHFCLSLVELWPGHCTTVAICRHWCDALAVLGITTASLCSKFWQVMLTQGLITGLGDAMFFVPSMVLIPIYFVKRRASSTAVAISGGAGHSEFICLSLTEFCKTGPLVRRLTKKVSTGTGSVGSEPYPRKRQVVN